MVFVILVDAQISLGNLEGGVVVDHHQDGGAGSLHPGMVSESFSQGMAADRLRKLERSACMLDNAKCLLPGEGAVPFSRKNILFRLSRRQTALVSRQGFLEVLVQGDDGLFPGFIFSQSEMRAEGHLAEVIDILPCKIQDVADTQGSVDASADQGIISQVWLIVQIEVFQCEQVFFALDWLRCRHFQSSFILFVNYSQFFLRHGMNFWGGRSAYRSQVPYF